MLYQFYNQGFGGYGGGSNNGMNFSFKWVLKVRRFANVPMILTSQLHYNSIWPNHIKYSR